MKVHDTNPSLTPGGGLGGLSKGADKGAGTLKVIPADETKEGVLCIEMRIRLYHDGAMSKILENLAKVGRRCSASFSFRSLSCSEAARFLFCSSRGLNFFAGTRGRCLQIECFVPHGSNSLSYSVA